MPSLGCTQLWELKELTLRRVTHARAVSDLSPLRGRRSITTTSRLSLSTTHRLHSPTPPRNTLLENADGQEQDMHVACTPTHNPLRATQLHPTPIESHFQHRHSARPGHCFASSCSGLRQGTTRCQQRRHHQQREQRVEQEDDADAAPWADLHGKVKCMKCVLGALVLKEPGASLPRGCASLAAAHPALMRSMAWAMREGRAPNWHAGAGGEGARGPVSRAEGQARTGLPISRTSSLTRRTSESAECTPDPSASRDTGTRSTV